MAILTLLPREDHNHHSETNYTCPMPNKSGPPIVPIVGTLTFHQLALIIAVFMVAFACSLSFFLIFRHATHFSVPTEQKQIIRITFIIPVFAIVSLIILAAEKGFTYLRPIMGVYEATALASFFFLLSNYVSRDEGRREEKLREGGHLGMYNRVWFLAFQQIVVMVVLLIATEITQAVGIYCEPSNKSHFAHVWLSAFETVTSMFAIVAVLGFYSATKSMTTEQKPKLKVTCFELIVFLWSLQNTIFHYVGSGPAVHANEYLSHDDFRVGIQSLMVCAEMMVFSVLFQLAYPIAPYVLEDQDGAEVQRKEATPHYEGGSLGIKAISAAANVSDLWKAILVAPSRWSTGRAMRQADVE